MLHQELLNASPYTGPFNTRKFARITPGSLRGQSASVFVVEIYARNRLMPLKAKWFFRRGNAAAWASVQVAK